MTSAPSPEPGPGRPTRAEIDTDAFRSNLSLAGRLAGRRDVMAVIKADAYGHGAVTMARAARREGAAMLGVATVAEADGIAAEAADTPVIILSEVVPSEVFEVVRLGCRQVVYTRELADALDGAGRAMGRKVPVHLKVDTGMGRVGVEPAGAAALAAYMEGLAGIDLEGFMTHLPEADNRDSGRTEGQVAEFLRLAGEVQSRAPGIRHLHCANSALIMDGKAAGSLVRPGIMLYGAPPAPDWEGGDALRPVMCFTTAVTFLKSVPTGSPLSYGGTFVTGRPSRIATLPVGYADGYPRLLSNNTEVLIRGRRAPQVGRICMDMTLVDVTDIPGAAVGDEVVLMGSQGGETVSADELAGKTGTISYEIFCNVSSRVPRVIAHGGARQG